VLHVPAGLSAPSMHSNGAGIRRGRKASWG
jgi:hypothetical protein